MANVYNLEPQPNAKVILQTTAGDLSLELWAKQTPLACRNFLQHCTDGYYNNTIFHRLVPGFIIQGGDPTGTGSGGISAVNDGDPFQDEFHSRLKFNRRGLLGMANEGADSNGSQFFLTLGATPELQGKHTMFGRIEGDTIYNLMKMAEAEMVEAEGSERPLYPTKITGSEIVVNPFGDMVARAREAPRTKDERGKQETRKRKKPAGKNVLSFGGDEGEGDMAAPVLKKAKANPKLVSAGIEEPEMLNDTALPEAPKEKKREQARRRRSSSPAASFKEREPSPRQSAPAKALPAEEDSLSSPEPEQTGKSVSMLEKTNAEIAALKASMKRNVGVAPKQSEKPKSALEAMIPINSSKGRKRGKASDEKGAIDMFKAFKQRLEGLPASEPGEAQNAPAADGNRSSDPAATGAADEEEAELCDLHFIANCQSCKAWDAQNEPPAEAEADAEGDTADVWMSHTLTFAKDTLGKDLAWRKNMEEIEVIDPREKARSIKEEKRKEKDKRKAKG